MLREVNYVNSFKNTCDTSTTITINILFH